MEVLERREMIVPVIGTTRNRNQGESFGVFYDITLVWEKRADHDGLWVRFDGGPGRFSPSSQTSIQHAIKRAAALAQADTGSWTVRLGVPDAWANIFGDSLSAMVGLSVVAMSRGVAIPTDRIMTGTILPNGRIGVVESVAQKIWNGQNRFRRIIIPGDTDLTELPIRMPFMVHIALAPTAADAYWSLTDEPLVLP